MASPWVRRRSRRFGGLPGRIGAILALLWLAPAPFSLSREPGLAPNASVSLSNRLANFVAEPRFVHAVWGIEVGLLKTNRPLFQHNARKLLIPASNAKLFTGALALDRFGADHRLRTSLYATRRPDDSGMLPDDLVVYGRGDPSFAVRFEGVTYTNLLVPLAEALEKAGVKRIQGDLIGDASFFRGPPLGSGWAWDDLPYYYGAEVSALTVQDNVVDVWVAPGDKLGDPCRLSCSPDLTGLVFDNRTRTAGQGSARTIDFNRLLGKNRVIVTGEMALESKGYWDAVSVHQPARWFLMLFKQALQRRGISVGGRLRVVDWLERDSAPTDLSNRVELASAESRPMAELVTKMMKPSQNLHAQLLLLQVGATQHAPTNTHRSTESLGLGELKKFCTAAGIPSSDVLIEEGAGLSRGTRVTPHATATLLRYMTRHPQAQLFRDALPLAGIDGSLKTRMKGTVAQGNVRAKTGTLSHVHSLSGYATNRAGTALVFTLMVNGYHATARSELDALAVMIAEGSDQ